MPFILQIKTKLITSTSYNPYENLALEEYLLNNVQDGEVILYLWQNENTIVIGKNQNPWKECRVSLVEKDGVRIARRLSGGGAVFHDLGNLNFTFIMKEALYDLDKQLETIISAAQSLGINAAFTGKNDITVDGKKFSGNAFYFSDEGSYHHGTILVKTDLRALGNYLQVSKEKMMSKGIDSVKSRVVNLVDLNPHITISKMSHALVKSFETIYKNPVEVIPFPGEKALQEKKERNASWEWLFSQTPKFDVKFEKRFDFGNLELLFSLKDSKIQKVDIYSDAVLTGVLETIKKLLVGVRFNAQEISQRLDRVDHNTDEEKKMITQIKQWIRTKEL